MKLRSAAIFFLLLSLLLPACSQQPDEEIDPMREQLQKRCGEIASVCSETYRRADKTGTTLSQSTIDEMEAALYDAGLDVIDTSGEYPAYLMTADRFRDFWQNVQSGKTAEQETITVRETGTFTYQLFTDGDGDACVYSMDYPMGGGSEVYYEKQEILEWNLTDKGNFYYRLYPAGDKHYADFSLIRLEASDPELCDLNRKYVMAGGYIGTNMYLTDWNEDNFENLSFNDMWEYLYYDTYGERFQPDGYSYIREQCCYEIPAEEFEKVILPYFDIDLDKFRELAHYSGEGDYYPWRQIETNDYVFLRYYMIEPEVTACQTDEDGTITLTVEMLSTDLKTDCLFAHELTVRPLENGKFQFVGNRVTYQTEYGLPFCQPRLCWKKTT